MMRIVITGATGNVGTSLVRALAEDPDISHVTGLARRAPEWRPPRTTWLRADVSRDDLVPHFRDADAVVHLAWRFQPTHRPDVTGATNLRGSYRVFDAVAAARVPALVYASSVGAYAAGPKDRRVDERWPTHGVDAATYSREKAAVERALDAFEARHPDRRVVRLRPGFIFKESSAPQQRRIFAGPLAPSRALGRGLLPLLPEPPGLRFQILHSADAAQAYRLALTRPVSGAFNLAAEPVVDMGVLGEVFGARSVGVPRGVLRAGIAVLWRLHALPVEPGLLDLLLRVPLMDVTRAHRELGWTPRHDALATLHALLAGLRSGAGLRTAPLHPRSGAVPDRVAAGRSAGDAG